MIQYLQGLLNEGLDGQQDCVDQRDCSIREDHILRANHHGTFLLQLQFAVFTCYSKGELSRLVERAPDVRKQGTSFSLFDTIKDRFIWEEPPEAFVSI